ncbi:MAG: nitroreductase family protein [Eubacteriales bacterium]
MKLEFPMEETVKTRYSVRTFKDQPLSLDTKKKLESYITALSNPFAAGVTFRLLESKTAVNGKNLGTYGMITGAADYFGATVSPGDLALEGLGYEFEKLVLYAASLGLGTCWLGGTFTRSEFAKAMDVKESDIFPAISPIGYPAGKKSMKESLVRKFVKADKRRKWEDLFFNMNFSTPLSQAEAGDYAFPLEMLRLAPSASNKQPWRIVKEGTGYHFYKTTAPGYSDRLGFDVQLVDMGIAACHFHLAALEKDLAGEFKVLPVPAIDLPENTGYVFTWVTD